VVDHAEAEIKGEAGLLNESSSSVDAQGVTKLVRITGKNRNIISVGISPTR
jgi:hypothetical protein